MSSAVAGGRPLPRISRLFTTPAPAVHPALGRPVPMVVFRAPRGWGKTTTTAAWIRSLGDEHRFDWLTITRPTGEREFVELLAAARERARADESADQGDGERVRTGRSHHWLVIDNLHLVETQVADDLLVELAMDDELQHIVATSETERRIETLAEIDADGLVFRAPELRLTGTEVRAMAQAACVPIDDETAWHFANEVLGWPALIRSLLLTSDCSWPLSWEARRRVRDYVEIIALGSRPDSTIHHAMRLALTNRPDEEITRLLVGRMSDAADEGHRLQADGFLGRDGHLPRTVRDALADALAATDPAEYSHLQMELARWYEQRGAVGRSLDHAARAGDEHYCRALLRDHWLTAAQHETSARHAMSVADRSAPATGPRFDVLRFHLDPTEPEPRAPTLTSLRTNLDWIVARLGTLSRPEQTSAMAREAVPQADEVGDPRLRDRTAAMAALVCAAAGATSDACRWLSRTSGTDSDQLRRVARLFVAHDTLVGPAPAPTPLTDPGGHPRARDRVDAPLDWLDFIELPLAMGFALCTSTDPGRQAGALQRHLEAIPKRDEFTLAITTTLSVLVSALIADQQFARCRDLLTEVIPSHPALRSARARLALCLGAAEDALSLTEHQQGDATDGSPRGSVEYALVRACALARLRRRGEAAAELEHALLVARGHDLIRPFLLVPNDALAQIVEWAPHLDALIWWGDLARFNARLSPRPSVVELSPSEHKALALLAEGMPLAAAARRMFVSANTIKSQLRSAYRKLGAHNREEAVMRARELLLLPPQSTAQTVPAAAGRATTRRAG